MKINKYFMGMVLATSVVVVGAISAFADVKTNLGVNGNVNVGLGGRMWNGQSGNDKPGSDNKNGGPGMMGGMRPAVVGTVTGVSGSTITVNGRGFGPNQASTTYTVNSSSATIVKNNATTTVSSITVGDNVLVVGTISGTNVTATSVRDGVFANGRGNGGAMGRGMMNDRNATSTAFKGNGQPVVAGTVSSISGSTLMITTSSNVTYTINASAATIAKGNTAIALTGITVGDYVVVQGAVNGTSITATSILDQQAHMNGGDKSGDNNENSGNAGNPAPHGFFGNVGQFFKHLFGF